MWVRIRHECWGLVSSLNRNKEGSFLPRINDGGILSRFGNVLVYSIQALSGGQTLHKKSSTNPLQQGKIKPSMLPIEVKTRQGPFTINQVRIIPRNGYYVVLGSIH